MHQTKLDILNKLTVNDSLKFTELQKLIVCPSDHLAYHLKGLVAELQVLKSDRSYSITTAGAKALKYFKFELEDMLLPHIKIQVIIEDQDNYYFTLRDHHPFFKQLNFPQSNLRRGETTEQALTRILIGNYNYNFLKTVRQICKDLDGEILFDSEYHYVKVEVTPRLIEDLKLVKVKKDQICGLELVPSSLIAIDDSIKQREVIQELDM